MSDPTAPAAIPSHIEMAKVDSSHHSRAGYDADARHLYIDFAREGAPPNVYRYSNFGPEDWAGYQGAESKGRHFLRNIKSESTKFPYVKVPNEQ